jgi:hypothetical protein
MVYAMIYVNGVSTWSDEVGNYLVAESLELVRANSLPLFEQAGGEDKFVEGKLRAADEGDDGAEKYAMGLKKQIPGYGKLVEQNSVDFCKRFAEKWQYKFLAWQRTSSGGCTIL